jgi:ABC-2 type transport system permease protein
VSTLAGLGNLVRFTLRRERLRLPIWIAVLGLLPIGTASAFVELYPTEMERQLLVGTVAANPAFIAMLGPIYGPSFGELTVWRVGTLGGVLVALMAVLTMIRHTRDEEESGRRELIGSTVVGRHAPLTAAFLVTAGAGVVLGGLLAGGLIGLGLPAVGSLGYGAGVAGIVIVFAGIAGLVAQLTEGAGAARGLAIASLGAAYLLRMAGDAGEAGGRGWLSWLSPIGWFTRFRLFSDERWWVLALSIGLGVLLVGAAFALSSRRDVGAGLLATRPGPAIAGPRLGSPLGLGWRLHRGSFFGWGAGLAAIGLIYGSVGNSVGDLVRESPQLAEIFERLGGEAGITDAFFSAAMGILAMVASAYAVRTALRLRVEEEALRAEPILATPVSRVRWTTSHLTFAVGGPVALLTFGGMAAAVSYGVVSGDLGGAVPRVWGTAMIQIPAVWVLAGVAAALFGLLPRLTMLSWAALVTFLLLGQLGEILQFPRWSLNLSPFSHIPRMPMEGFDLTPLVILTLIAAGLVAAGLVGIRRRDIG